MNDLADKLYEANQAADNIEVDELGIPVRKDRDTKYEYDYITARCFKRNPHIHVRPDGNLYNSHTLIKPELDDIAQLSNWVGRLPRQAVIYIYNRMKDVAPRLDPNIIAITPTLGWDFDKQSFCKPPDGEKEFNVISDW